MTCYLHLQMFCKVSPEQQEQEQQEQQLLNFEPVMLAVKKKEILF